jgi:uncharacterized membrane protein YjjP (DUF1212 family)
MAVLFAAVGFLTVAVAVAVLFLLFLFSVGLSARSSQIYQNITATLINTIPSQALMSVGLGHTLVLTFHYHASDNR